MHVAEEDNIHFCEWPRVEMLKCICQPLFGSIDFEDGGLDRMDELFGVSIKLPEVGWGDGVDDF